jgi:competence protein ComEA
MSKPRVSNKPLVLSIALACTGAFAEPEVNHASLAELEALSGIGTGIAARIIDERSKAPFKSWGDLITRIKGLGDSSAAKLSSAGLTVNGAPYPANAKR